MESPLVSIIIPCYNQAKYLEETLQSVLDQEYYNWECIIINDGSPDNTEEIALKWVSKDNRFKYIKIENGGVSNARNCGIRNSSGKYILPLDADDKIGINYAKEAINILESDSNVRIIYSNITFFGLRNEDICSPEYKFENMLIENQIHNSAFFRREDFPLQGYNVNMVEGLEDWDFWLNIVDKDIKVVKLEGFHFLYRIKESSRSTEIDLETNKKLFIQIFRNHQNKFLKYINPIWDHAQSKRYKNDITYLLKRPQWQIGRIIYAPITALYKIRDYIFSKNS